MDKSLLYKLPKDILVELVCKNFDRLSVKELGEIYQKKCCKELNRYREILDKTHRAGKINIEYVKGVIHIDDTSGDFYKEIYISDLSMEDDCGETIRFKSMELLLIQFQEIMLKENFDAKTINDVMKIIRMLFKIYYEKQDTEENISDTIANI